MRANSHSFLKNRELTQAFYFWIKRALSKPLKMEQAEFHIVGHGPIVAQNGQSYRLQLSVLVDANRFTNKEFLKLKLSELSEPIHREAQGLFARPGIRANQNSQCNQIVETFRPQIKQIVIRSRATLAGVHCEVFGREYEEDAPKVQRKTNPDPRRKS